MNLIKVMREREELKMTSRLWTLAARKMGLSFAEIKKTREATGLGVIKHSGKDQCTTLIIALATTQLTIFLHK